MCEKAAETIVDARDPARGRRGAHERAVPNARVDSPKRLREREVFQRRQGR